MAIEDVSDDEGWAVRSRSLQQCMEGRDDDDDATTTYCLEKRFPQAEQAKGFSLVWLLMWRVKCSCRANVVSQTWHL